MGQFKGRRINRLGGTRRSSNILVARQWKQTFNFQYCLGLLLVFAFNAADVAAQTNEPIDFGRQVQPIFAKRCFACHGPDKAEAGLRLDRKESASQKLDSGKTAVIAGAADQSELMQRITSTDDGTRMPPEGTPLSPSQIELMKKWIEEGASWKEHWAFESPHTQLPPQVKAGHWVVNPIDAFVLQKLEQNGLNPAPPAAKEELLRRLTYDLTGLPPSIADVQSFVANNRPDAYEKVVDRLLQSERFGENWARHWLDVVRYADTNSFERDGPKPNAWRYRDYVIRAFNQDKPYDRFIREQLAGDELPDGGNDGLIATGFYRLGLWDDEPADRVLAAYDVLDDIITTTSQGFLGLTMNCARCHDHKIDPITQGDYYSLLAFFQGVTPNGNPNPNVERPIFENEAARQSYESAVALLRERSNSAQAAVTEIEEEFRARLRDKNRVVDRPDLDDLEYKFYRDTWTQLPDFDNLKSEKTARLEKGYFDLSPATREFSFGFVFRGVLVVPADGEYTFFVDSDDGSRLLVNGERVVEYDGLHGLGEPRTGKITLSAGRIPIRLDYFQGESLPKGLDVKWSGPGFEKRPLSVGTLGGAKAADAGAKGKDFAALMTSLGSEVLGAERFEEFKNRTKRLDELKREKIDVSMALCVTEVGATAPDSVIFKRGNPHSPGDKVVPSFPALLGGTVATVPAPPPTAKSSGRRLVLANWIASPDNRLTARVMVNRLWQHYFGHGIVRSANNFGLLGDRPTHPELLDWLAIEFVGGDTTHRSGGGQTGLESTASGTAPWSLKRMHKMIVMSNAYRMSSRWQPAANGSSKADPHRIDPLNDLLWRHDMRRLNAEEIRDSILAVDGRLNLKMYGPGVFPRISDEVKAGQSNPGQGWGTSSEEDQVRRSVYVHVKRSLLLPILSDFDFADTDSSCSARFITTQPTQALGMLNGDFLNQEASEFASRLKREAGEKLSDQVKLAYRLSLCREPDQEMVDRGLKLIERLKSQYQLSQEKAIDQFCLMVLNLNEFVYLD